MIASRPPQRAPVVPEREPVRSGGSGLFWVLALVLGVAGFAFVLVLPRWMGWAFDPLSLVGTASVGPPSSDPSHPIDPIAAVDPVAAPAPAAIDAGSDAATAPPITFAERDPWLEPIPDELARFRERVAAGETLGRGARASLRQVAHAHPGDPRAFLLMGHSDVAEHHYNDAMDHYETAMGVSAVARLDPQMLENLVVMCGSSDVDASRRARRTVRRLYGLDALPTLRAVRTRTLDTEAIERLDLLEEELSEE